MDLNSLSAYSSLAAAIGQLVGALAVVISLIYVAQQLRHSARAVQAQTCAAIMTNSLMFTTSVYSHPEVGELFAKAASDSTPLSEAESIRWRLLMRTMFHQFETIYYETQSGALDPAIWSGYERIMASWLRYPGCFRWFEDNVQHFSVGLQNLYATRIRPEVLRAPAKQEAAAAHAA